MNTTATLATALWIGAALITGAWLKRASVSDVHVRLWLEDIADSYDWGRDLVITTAILLCVPLWPVVVLGAPFTARRRP